MVYEFSLDQINEATNKFSAENFVKSGGEGEVYKGDIQIGTRKTKTTVAVKRLFLADTREFEKEIELLEGLHHANLVSLQGFCRANGKNILVYEYLHNGNLREKLYQNPCLTWMQRLNICCGAARGLDHLHSGTSTDIVIIHRDIKPENILLDGKLNAKVSDFGISKKGTVDDQRTVAIETRIAGTRGYYAPELAFNPEFTKRTDVYAFGVLLFEVLCKKRPPLPKAFRDPDKKYDMDGPVADLALRHLDPDLNQPINKTSIESFIDITERCLSDDQYRRPPMSEVVSELEKAKLYLRDLLSKAVSLPTSSKSTNFRLKESSLLTSAKSAPSTRPPSSKKVTNNIRRPAPSEFYLAGEEDKIVLYYTSYALIGKVTQGCEEVLSILIEYNQVEKRDVSRKESYRTQLQKAFKGYYFRLPQLFIGGRHVGGADKILQLYESGELDELFEPFTAA